MHMVQYAESMQYSEQIRPKDNNKNNSQQQSKRGKKITDPATV
jgi:hypothetical protein